ncbi:MAG: hypothetical protein ACM3ZA_04710 [Bacillota bacterium]
MELLSGSHVSMTHVVLMELLSGTHFSAPRGAYQVQYSMRE